MSCIENPFSVLYDESGRAMAVSASQAVDSAQSGFAFLGSSSVGYQNIKISSTGEIFITGSLNTIASGIQQITGSVYVTNMPNTASNGNLTVNQGLSASFADAWKVVLTDGTSTIFGTNASPLWVTGSVTVGNVVSITGSVLTRDMPFSSSSTTIVTASIVPDTIVQANGGRRSLILYNEGAATAYVKLGTSVTTTNYTSRLGVGGSFIIPEGYTGPIAAVFSTALGNMLVTELS